MSISRPIECSRCIGDYDQAVTLVVQRKRMKGQRSLIMEDACGTETHYAKRYTYRAIVTNRSDLSDNEVTHWYNIVKPEKRPFHNPCF